MKKIKILQIISDLNTGGAQKVVLNYFNNLNKFKDIDCYLLVLDNKNINNDYFNEIEQKDKVIFLENNLLSIGIINKVKQYGRIRKQVKKVLVDVSPDITHMHLYGSLLYCLSPILSYNKSVNFYTLHSNPMKFKNCRLFLLKRAFKNNIVPICLNEYQASIAKKRYKFINYEIVHNWLDFDAVRKKVKSKKEARKIFNLKEDEYVICTVGRLHEIKNQAFLIKCMKNIIKKQNKSRLIIAGDGPEREKLENLTSELELRDYVKFLGNINNVIDLYCAADMFVLPSFSEQSPLVLLEAQACNLRCVISNGVPTESIVTDYVQKIHNGYDEEQWAKAILNNEFINDSHTQEKEYDIQYILNNLKNMYIKYYSLNNGGERNDK